MFRHSMDQKGWKIIPHIPGSHKSHSVQPAFCQTLSVSTQHLAGELWRKTSEAIKFKLQYILCNMWEAISVPNWSNIYSFTSVNIQKLRFVRPLFTACEDNPIQAEPYQMGKTKHPPQYINEYSIREIYKAFYLSTCEN